MKFVLALVSCAIIAYGCKPVDHSKSEEKGFRNIAKQLAKKVAKEGDLSNEAKNSIKNLVGYGSDSKKGIEHMKKALAKGGSISDEAVLVYVRAYNDMIREWDELIELSREKIARLPVPAPIDALKEIHNRVFIETDILLRRLNGRVTQVKDMLFGIDDLKRAESLAKKLFNLDKRKTANDESIQFIKGISFFPKKHKKAVRGSDFVERLTELNLYTRFQELMTKENNLIMKYTNFKNLTPIGVK